MKKVLLISSWYYLDVSEFVIDYAKMWKRMGYEAEVLALSSLGFREKGLSYLQVSEKLEFDKEGVKVVYKAIRKLPKNERLNTKIWLAELTRFYQEYVVKNGHPDCIHAHSVMWAGVAAMHIKKQFTIPVIITEHRGRFVANNSEAAARIKTWQLKPVANAFAHADVVVGVSQAMTEGISTLIAPRNANIETIYNPIDQDFFIPTDQAKSAKEFRFFTAGSLEDVKGIDVLLKAFSQLIEKVKHPVSLSIAGEGSKQDELQHISKSLGMEDKVKFLGQLSLPQLREEYWNAHAFVLASRFEAFGMVLVEALFCGNPVIATRSGGPAGIVHAENGFLVESNSPEELSKSMYQMMQDYQKFDADKIREAAIKQYAKHKIQNQYLKLSRNLIS